MEPRILQLQSTTVGGERLTCRQIADVQEIVSALPLLSRTELGQTVCAHLGWQTPNGNNRIQSATGLLAALERLGILSLPAGGVQAAAAGGGAGPGGGRGVERMGAALPSDRLPAADGQPCAVSAARAAATPSGLPEVPAA
ncbi:MAG: hypothetical protein OXN97_03985 [Bryobacterales bacterium]|nr:hypothetical protein [Bryobacterales bacterium]MDE0624843.1 hypothetical protein [Bryobacterales bacterium]